jgi:hypothetical protein
MAALPGWNFFVQVRLGRVEVLALDGVLQRVLELIRVDVPIGVLTAVLLARAAMARRFRHAQVAGSGGDPDRR